jgi:L-ascorbate metabolism protein UlaG (beta-lactamase superfamily)
MFLSLISLVVVVIVSYFAFVNYYPSFGGDASEDQKKEYQASSQFKDGKFVNQIDIPRDPSFMEIVSIARKVLFQNVKNEKPKKVNIQKIDSLSIADYNDKPRLIWFGHSAFLLQIDSKNILIDPMLSGVPAPHPWLGSSRFHKELPLEIEKLPKIDAVLISHDHYDHLDYETIKKLKHKVETYIVPLGVEVHLEAWGIDKNQIQKLDWWDTVNFKNIEFVCTPAQHFSGRKLNNGQSTLWSSWVIKTSDTNIFFSGDSGYNTHFKEIGEKYGPFDIALMECGQYNKMWADIHMFPEQTAQAGLDVKADLVMPIHWGSFKLALHSWTDPVERVSKKAAALQIPLITPQIGTPIVIGDELKSNSNWWTN